jgi:predicted RNA-binding Zn ribbon-like protein
VQLFINSNDREEGIDLFEDPEGLRAWMLRNGFPAPQRISQRDRLRVVELREALRALAGANNGRPANRRAIELLNDAARRLPVRVRFDARGKAELEPQGKGIDALLATLVAVVTTAQHSGSWQRLKACSRDICQWVFYDRSRNRSGAWCDMAICGSREKAMAYYRRRTSSAHSARRVASGKDPAASSRSWNKAGEKSRPSRS